MISTAPPRRGTLRTGEYAGRFRIGWLVGVGATSEIYVAGDERLGRDVVLKLLTEPDPDGSLLRRLEHEVAALQSASHPNVIPLHECGRFGDRAYLVTEFAEGGSLADRLHRATPALAQSLRLLKGIAAALDHLHQHGIVHGDVKPANVLLGRGARPLLADFGTARLPSDAGPPQTGRPRGTPFYMAPEQIRGRPLEPAADVYSFSILAFQLLSGRLPFVAEVPADVMHLHLTALPPPLSASGSGLPGELDQLLERGMAKRPDDRWRTCTALVSALEGVLTPAREPVPRDERLAARLIAGLFAQARGLGVRL